ncbi:MAG: coiled-coil protein [Nitrososphaeraceae archaeon]
MSTTEESRDTVQSKRNSKDLTSIELNLKNLVEFKESLVNNQKNLDEQIQNTNEKIEKTKKEIDGERKKLEDLRVRLKEVNDVKEEEFPKFMELKNTITKARNQMKLMDEKAGNRSFKERSNIKQLSRTLEQLEKDIQTKKLSKEEERRLVSRAKEIATKLHALKIIHKKEDQYRNISSEYNILKSKINELFDKRSEFGNKIGDIKKSLDKLLNSREDLYEERRKTIREVREINSKLEMVNTQISAIEFKRSRISSPNKRFKDRFNRTYGPNSVKERSKRNKENQEMWNSLKEQALKKMSSGEKLTFDEMKLIYSDINSD